MVKVHLRYQDGSSALTRVSGDRFNPSHFKVGKINVIPEWFKQFPVGGFGNSPKDIKKTNAIYFQLGLETSECFSGKFPVSQKAEVKNYNVKPCLGCGTSSRLAWATW